jgi:amino acid transporter
MSKTSDSALEGRKLGFNATWSMAVGGMVGGGIFSTLGVVIGISGSWAWLSFLTAGLVAFCTAYAYSKLAEDGQEAGGAFTFLREMDMPRLAGGLAWVLLVGYVLTNAVYAFTFGQYLANVVDLGPWFARVAGLSIVALFVVINLRGVGESSAVEIFLVWFKLVVLVGLAGYGIAQWQPELVSRGVPATGPLIALFGAASVFMAYEGFQLLTYDYDDIDHPERILRRATLSAVAVVVVVYVAVTIGVPMIIGADTVVDDKEVALAVAGQEMAGTVGLIVVTIAAAFSTGSAINSTLFATARLSHQVATAGELPAWIDHRNSHSIPDRAVLVLGAAAGLLAMVGSLVELVEAASLAFLGTFAVVCWIAFHRRIGNTVVTGSGMAGAAAATAALVVRLAISNPGALIAFGALVLLAFFGRPWILARVETEGPEARDP